MSDKLRIALRAYPEVTREPRQQRRRRKPARHTRRQWPEAVLAFDVETSTDRAQRLLFGSYRYGRWRADGTLKCVARGLIYGDDLPERDPGGLSILEEYARARERDGEQPQLRLLSRREFVDQVFYPAAYKSRALVVGFNLPFDISRIATGWGEARGKRFRGGFTFPLFVYEAEDGTLRENRYRPRIRIKSLDSKRAFIEFARPAEVDRIDRIPDDGSSTPDPRFSFRGYFLDLKTLAFALTNAAYTLRSACNEFNVEQGKLEVEEHGIIAPRYIDYNLGDVTATCGLLEKLRAEFDRHPINLAPWKAYSPASVAKAYLTAMGVRSPRVKFSGVGPDVLGAATMAYYGGRAEARIRKTSVPVVHTDFTSMYPTVNTLMGLWRLLSAERLEIVDATDEVKALLNDVSAARCFDPDFWRELSFFALVQPEGEVLPVRAQYDDSNQGYGIGNNPFTARAPVWCAGPDAVTSVVQSGQTLEVLEAFRIVPVGVQAGLKPVRLRGRVPVNPDTDDFFRRVIEERKRIERREDLKPEERERLSGFLKVLANSGSYGIFAEMNRQTLARGETAEITIHGVNGPFNVETSAPEEPGRLCFPPLAALITSAARLMLALLEKCVIDRGGAYAFCDTDSLAIVASEHGGLIPCAGGPHTTADGEEAVRALSWSAVNDIVRRFETLNPYDRSAVPGSVLKVEDVNVGPDAKRRPLHAYAISAKRYAMFVPDPANGIRVVKNSEHGLGHVMDPTDPRDERRYADGSRVSIRALWRAIICEVLGLPFDLPTWIDLPAVSRFTASSPRMLRPFDALQEDLAYADQIKPFNFLLSAHVAPLGHPAGADPTSFHLIAPFESDPSTWLELPWLDRGTGKRWRITTDPNAPPYLVRVRSYRDVLDAYKHHPEPKSAAPDGSPCTRQTIGLLARRPVAEASRVYVGKEANRLEEVESGQVHDWSEVRSVYFDPADDPFDTKVRPRLHEFKARELADVAGVCKRQIKRYRNGKARPRRNVERRLRRFLREHDARAAV